MHKVNAWDLKMSLYIPYTCTIFLSCTHNINTHLGPSGKTELGEENSNDPNGCGDCLGWR